MGQRIPLLLKYRSGFPILLPMTASKTNRDSIIDSIPYGLFVVQADPKVLGPAVGVPHIKFLNPAACALLDYTEDELVGRPITMILDDEADAALFYDESLKTLKEYGAVSGLEKTFKTKYGDRIPVLLSLSLVDGSDRDNPEIVCIAQDNSERKQTEEELLKMVRAVEQSPNGVVITDSEGHIEYTNPKFSQLTGYSAEELIGHNPKILQSGQTSPEMYQALWQTILAGGDWRGEIQNRKKNGELFWARESISPIRNSQGEITHFLAIEEDITARKQIEMALQESEERFRQMAEMTGEWLWEQDPEGYYIYSSAAVKSILGYTPEEIVGKHYTELFTKEDRENLPSSTATHEPFFALTNHYRHRDGRKIYTESTGVPITNAYGKLVKWRGVDRDITARKHFEDALKESEKRTRLIIESAMDAIIIMDERGIITDWNPQAETMFGWKRREVIGRVLDETVMPKRFRTDHRSGLEKFLTTGTGPILNQLIEHTAVRRDGGEFPVELSISPLRLGDSYVFSGFIRDITERKQAEMEIRRVQVKLAVAHSEMKIARQIQESLFPAAPLVLPEIEVMGCCLPAAQVGGDYFDYFRREDDSIDIVIADVSGHSVGPALFMVEARSALRSQFHSTRAPSDTLAIINESMYEDLYHAEHFITMFYMQYNSATRELSYTNAGHPPPLLLRREQKSCMKLDTEGLVIGVKKKVDFEEKRVVLNPGDTIVLYTDGITEAENSNGEFFGATRLCEILHKNTDLSPQKTVWRIIEDLQDFCGTKRFKDDITLMILKVT
ncbi:MAG: PAS domain S-box protein [Pseudomonadota bacterium]